MFSLSKRRAKLIILMSRKTILLFLLMVISQNFSLAQDSLDVSLKNLQERVDSIVNLAIKERAFPGCVVFALYQDQEIIKKAYGYHLPDSIQPVTLDHLYDLASITKVLGSTLVLMQLYEQGFFKLDDPLGMHLKGLGIQGLQKVTFRQVLAHQAGLPSWIKYYEDLQKGNGLDERWITNGREGFSISDSLSLKSSYYPKIKRKIARSRLSKNPEFQYSDLFFYLVPELIESWTGETFEDYLNNHFYLPLGANTLCFNPDARFPKTLIVPTEVDTFFRRDTIHAKVHDEGAILMQGVSGHAGLFGSAPDISKVLQMLLNLGSYEGRRYLKPETILLFTTAQYPQSGNRRGLGFDKPLLKYDSLKSTVAKEASKYSYGHSGFTGTLFWVDPEYDLIYIFLSNRVFPSRKNTAIYTLNVRPSIHALLYDFIIESELGQ